MSATFSTIPYPARAKTFDAYLWTCWKRIARYFAHRAAITSLRELDDRSLRDIGLTRSQIEAAVHGFIPAPNRARM
jgi:uncharacterized protein YjiS (DUF1127 family)